MNKHVRILMSLVVITAMAACNRNTDTLISAPKVSVIGKTQDSLRLGQTIRLSPAVSQLTGVRYQWLLNNAPVGEDSVYTFEAKERGDFRITFRVTNATGVDSAAYQFKVFGNYENGFFVLNEGWFGHETGSVHFYAYGADTLAPWVYTKENPGKALGGAGNTLQYGTVYNNKLYLVVKAGGPLVVTDAYSLKETGRIEKVTGNGQTFAGLDNTRGLLGTGNGVYLINLVNLSLGTKIADVTGTVGNMLKAGNYAFIHTSTDGMVVLDAATYGVVKKTKATIGFVQAKNGDVYAAKDSFLMSINPQTLVMDSAKMKIKAVSPWGAWRSVSMAASTKDNHVFIAEPGKGFSYGTKLYRYIIGHAASLHEPFITLPTGQYFYGAGVAYDSRTNELVITTVNGNFTGDVNRVLFYDASTGTLKKTITYNGWYFPAMIVFQP